MQVRPFFPLIVLTALVTACVLLFNYWAPFQFASMAAYAGAVLVLAGAVCTLFPFRFLGVQRRVTGFVVMLAGLLLASVALIWPAPLVKVERRSTRLDEIRPDYHFYERHSAMVDAPPAQVMAAIQETTFGELPAYVGLMRVRGAVLRQKVLANDKMSRMRILDVMAHPGSGFVTLDQSEHEIVMGMAGQPWAGGRSPGIADASQYAGFQGPGSVKIAFNLRVEDAGGGHSLLTTETRILGLDDVGRRTMARYWRLIVPGSGLIRRQWLNAIRERAEGRSRSRTT